jgi:hypothetical protein
VDFMLAVNPIFSAKLLRDVKNFITNKQGRHGVFFVVAILSFVAHLSV